MQTAKTGKNSTTETEAAKSSYRSADGQTKSEAHQRDLRALRRLARVQENEEADGDDDEEDDGGYDEEQDEEKEMTSIFSPS
jgi:hypothetical protein